jgi:hypothetical protein
MIFVIAHFTRPGLSHLAFSVRSSKVGLARVLLFALLSSSSIVYCIGEIPSYKLLETEFS